MQLYITQGNTEQYERIKYPAGELQVRLTKQTLQAIDCAGEVTLTWRIRSSDDVMELILLRDAIGLLVEKVRLLLPYMPYSRADRPFQRGDCFGLKAFVGVLAGRFNSVATIDAHSVMTEALGVVNVPANSFIETAIRAFMQRYKLTARPLLLFPDKGAAERYPAFDCPVAYCTKRRDPVTGVLSGFDVPSVTGPALVVDDLCDGGGTFLGVANELQDSRLPLGLYVTHGIFSKGMTDLYAAYDHIYTTDTICSVAPSPQLTVIRTGW